MLDMVIHILTSSSWEAKASGSKLKATLVYFEFQGSQSYTVRLSHYVALNSEIHQPAFASKVRSPW